MPKITKITDGQQITTSDLQFLAQDPRDAMDMVVNAAVNSGSVYYGASVTINGTTSIKVATPAILLSAGAVYDNQTAGGVIVDLISQLPTSGNKRIVAVVLQGTEADSDTEARDVVVNASTNPPTVEAQPLATRRQRLAVVATVIGVQAPTPIAPAIPSGNTLIAYVTLNSTQVESVQQVTDTQIVSLGDAVGRLVNVEAWQSIAQALLDGLRVDVAKLQNASAGAVQSNPISYVLEQLARVAAASGVSESASYSNTDFFLDTSESDLTNVNYLALVSDGLRFDYANESQTALQLLNPSDSNLTLCANGMVLPVFTDKTIISVVGKDSETSLSSVSTQNVSFVQKTISRTNIRYGQSESVCTNSAFWQSGHYDPLTNIFTDGSGETWTVDLANSGNPNINHQLIRITQFWEDSWTFPYWDVLTTTDSYTGVVSAQSFLMPQTAWVQKLNFGFSRLDTGGDVKVLLCECTASGAPDTKKVLQTVLIPYNNLRVFPALTSTPILPTLLTAGTRYAIVLITTGNHWVAQVSDNKYSGGTFFQSTDGAWFQGNLEYDMCFEIIAAQFSFTRYTVSLQPWNLDGGMSDIGLLLTMIAPDPAAITFEYQVDGIWYPIAPPTTSGNSPLFGLPAAVPARMTFQGTADLMPGIVMTQSYVRPSRPRTNFTHISTARTSLSPATAVDFDVTLENFDPAHHTCTAKILTGASYSTQTSPTATVDQLMPDGSLKRTFHFTGLPSITQFKRRIDGTTDSALDVFLVDSVTDIVFP